MHESLKKIIRLSISEFNHEMSGALRRSKKTNSAILFWGKVCEVKFRYESYCRFIEKRNLSLKKYY